LLNFHELTPIRDLRGVERDKEIMEIE
jgi:hypothetical protein